MASTITSFSDFAINKQLLNAVNELGYTTPTPIQQEAIPVALAGQDVLGIAQTGTGKTAAYALPILMKTKYAQGFDPRALILAPTRELTIQIAEHLKALAKYTDLRILPIYGGKGIKQQIAEVQAGVDILIATPGRFIDIYAANGLKVKLIKTMVLDEADRILDMGFMPQINRILEIISPKKRQNLLFSATMQPNVLALTENFLDFPVTVEVTPETMAAETVEQNLYKVPNFKTKINLLGKLLPDSDTFSKVIIFVRSKSNADNIFKYITRKLHGKVKVIHANKDQNTRINSIEAFKTDPEIKVLVATDVAARGLDVSLVSHVINFDVPILYEDYVHRIGRTGRALNKGIALTFCNEAEEYHIDKIETLIKQKINIKEIPADVEITPTPFAEQQEIAREIDYYRKKDDPDYKGAFHEKKRDIGKHKGFMPKEQKKKEIVKNQKKGKKPDRQSRQRKVYKGGKTTKNRK